MIEAIGYIATVLVLAGYACNSQQRYALAVAIWLLGDSLWIAYDVVIHNVPHTILSACICMLNLRAIWRLRVQGRLQW
jgi:hypothetical protein